MTSGKRNCSDTGLGDVSKPDLKDRALGTLSISARANRPIKQDTRLIGDAVDDTR